MTKKRSTSYIISMPNNIKYIYDQLTTNKKITFTINTKIQTQILKFIAFLDNSHKLDQQWFELRKYLVIQFKLPIIYFLEHGFKILSKKINNVAKQNSEHQISDIVNIALHCLEKTNSAQNLKSIGLGFLQEFKRYPQNCYTKQIILTNNQIQWINTVSSLYHLTSQRKNYKRYNILKEKIGTEIAIYQIQSKKIHQHCQNVYQRCNYFQQVIISQLYEKYQNFRIFNYKYKFSISAQKRKIILNNQDISQTSLKTSKIQQKKIRKSISKYLRNKNQKYQVLINNQIINKNQLYQASQSHLKSPNFKEKILNLQTREQQQTCQEGQQKKSHNVSARLCCRNYFYKGQKLGPQTLDVQYKQYSYPWTSSHLQTLGKTMCAFLNSHGGNIYIGIFEDDQYNRTVVGQTYDEKQKQQIHKYIRGIAQNIKPDIVNNRFFNVNFVPVKINYSRYAHVANLFKQTYVIKISVNQGYTSQVYCYSHNHNQMVCFRTNNQILTIKSISQILQIQKKRINKQVILQKLYPHQNSCQYQFYGVNNQIKFNNNEKKQDIHCNLSKKEQKNLKKQQKKEVKHFIQPNSKKQQTKSNQKLKHCMLVTSFNSIQVKTSMSSNIQNCATLKQPIVKKLNTNQTKLIQIQDQKKRKIDKFQNQINEKVKIKETFLQILKHSEKIQMWFKNRKKQTQQPKNNVNQIIY